MSAEKYEIVYVQFFKASNIYIFPVAQRMRLLFHVNTQ